MADNIIAKENNENPLVCSKCKGNCCKSLPGEYWPQDFNNDINTILKAIYGGEVAIDWWDNYKLRDGVYTEGYYLRPKVKGVDDLFDPSWGGECSYLTDSGCSLSFEERPTICRELTPDPLGERCVSFFSKYDSAKMWEPYHSLIRTIHYSSEQMLREIEHHKDSFPVEWICILGELDKTLSSLVPNYKILQIKEKFGALRIYISVPQGTPTDDYKCVQEAVRDAEEKSKQIGRTHK